MNKVINRCINFCTKDFLIGVVKITRNAIKTKLIYSGYEIAFDGIGSSSFKNEFTQIFMILIFVEGNTLSKHSENLKHNFLILSDGSTDNINDSIADSKKYLPYQLQKTQKLKLKKFSLDFHENGPHVRD